MVRRCGQKGDAKMAFAAAVLELRLAADSFGTRSDRRGKGTVP